MTTIKTDEDIELLRVSGRHLCEVLNELESMIEPGVETTALNDAAVRLIKEKGDVPAFLHYKPSFSTRPYPAAVCVSVNDVIVHGIPNENNYVLQEGDIVGIDAGVIHKGLVTDSARTVPVGKISKEAQKLIDVTREARAHGIKAARAGNHVGDIGHAIESFVKPFGYGVVEELCGHGVGYKVHEEPSIPNFGKPGTGEELKPGMVIAIEPMLNLGSRHIVSDADDYTIRTADGSISAHFEHTIVITDGDPEIITECKR